MDMETDFPDKGSPSHLERMRGFEAWVQEEVLAGRFQPETVVVYRSIWQAWCDWLTQRGCQWSQASAKNVQTFLDGPAPGQRRHRNAIRSDSLANFTKQRYWRVLRGVYACAKRLELVEDNPTLEVPEELRPVINRRSLLPQVLPPGVLTRLQQPETITALIPVLKETHWWSLRNRAVLSVLAHLGLTTAELGQLCGRDLRMNGSSWVDQISGPSQNSFGQNVEAAEIRLDVPRGGALLGRSLNVSPLVQRHLHVYLLARQQLFGQRLLSQWKSGIRASKAGYEHELRELLRSAALFPSRKCLGGDRLNLPGIDEVTVFELVQKVLRSYFETSEGGHVDPRASGVYIGHGAAIVRNSLIAQWISQLGPEEAVERAGFCSQESLRQHTAVVNSYDKSNCRESQTLLQEMGDQKHVDHTCKAASVA